VLRDDRTAARCGLQTGSVPHVAAVLDWELATLGDPVADLGDPAHLLARHRRRRKGPDHGGSELTTFPGFLTTSALAERYAVRTGRDLSTLTFHRALAAMKLGVILEGVHSRYLGGKAIGEGYAAAGTAVPALAARGLRLLAAPATHARYGRPEQPSAHAPGCTV
jgi:aminoglycoside phosphotransferase (APT) family kinase protein